MKPQDRRFVFGMTLYLLGIIFGVKTEGWINECLSVVLMYLGIYNIYKTIDEK
jgi:uncharacterized membrane protein